MKLLQDFGVRAWLATLVVLPTAIVLFILAAKGSEVALTTLVAMATGALAFYFGQRSKE
jgi:hypothetical protein